MLDINNRFFHILFISMIMIIFIGYFSNSLLDTWIFFNIFISIYEMYIIIVRKKLTQDDCRDNFWTEKNDGQIFRKAWNEYACVTDKRYFSPNSYVFLFEFINVIITIFLFLNRDKKDNIKKLLLLQFINASIYFTTLTAENKRFGHIYRSISALWLICPVLLIFNLS